MEDNTLSLVSENLESTVVAEYTPAPRQSCDYQSEEELEQAFIDELKLQAYEHLNVTTESGLIANLRLQLEKLNRMTFTDSEWQRFFKTELANPNQSIEQKTRTIQEDHIKNLVRDDGTTKNIYLLKKDVIHDNTLQVVNQYEAKDGRRENRYDVTILVNGLPLVHVELKRRGVALQEAFNQINRYQRESFWASSGLFEYVQIFVISNGTHTKYYSNTTRNQHIKEGGQNASKEGKKTSNSFEFTNWWADATNRPIQDLIDFAKTFFAKHAILNILTKYCVFTTDQLLLVMRPYQIVATEKILKKIEISTNLKTLGSVDAGGFIWHTTGSGKTLTSFKTAQLATKLPYIEKVLFVVDRKDLDYQTMKEYDKFEKGAANSNKSTAVLKRQLEDRSSRIIITTIQKLDRFIGKNAKHAIFSGHVVLIFDECHRSQFGDMHTAITKAFKNYHLFGFTGTPIFAINASAGGRADLKTTEQAFGEKLHTYTIVDAISDRNVLPFKVDYVSTVREAENIKDEEVADIDREAVLSSPSRLANIVSYIREHFDQKTKRNSFYKLQERRLAGFNSIFAVSSIDVAKKYYAEFKKQLEGEPSDKKLKIALIYSFGVNEDIEGVVDENSDDTSGLDQSSRDFLEDAIADYNVMFKTNYDTSSDKFQNYYKDVSQRTKDREIDILIVVNMFLTGFDATTLNTLWVDKNLRLHGLLQAFSRTNRILNSIKTFGNIVCFRNLEQATNESLSLFGDRQAGGIVLLKSFSDYYYGYKDGERFVRGYESLVKELLEMFPLGKQIVGENNEKDFIRLYGAILKVGNILTTFDSFAGKEMLSVSERQDYQSVYIDLYNSGDPIDKENINQDVVFEMELVKQVEINIDQILELIRKYHCDHTRDREIVVDITRAIDSSLSLRNKKELILQFLTTCDAHSEIEGQWLKYVEKQKVVDLEVIIAEENLDYKNAFAFMSNAFRNGRLETTGTALVKVLPPCDFFTGDHDVIRERVVDKLKLYFDRFYDVSTHSLRVPSVVTTDEHKDS
jgi:type I restriction enzyme R subunit